MDIIVLLLIVFFAVSGLIVARVIINKRKRQRELRKQEETRKEQEKLAEKAEDEVKNKVEEKAHLATAIEHETEEKIKAEEKEAQERLRKEREDESLRKEEARLKIKAEEEKIDQGAREKATKEEEERARLESEEKEGKEEKEAKARKAEEEETPKKESSEDRSEERKRSRIPPAQRGGRPRSKAEQSAIATSQESKPRPLRPEIICWNKGWEWIGGIEVPEEFASPQVTQNDELLEKNASDESYYHLRHIEDPVKVAWTEGEQDREIEIPIMEEWRNFLIFKMRKNWKGLGRLVRRPTTGYYLIIAPQEWERYEETSGSAPVTPENVQIDGYKAHFFALGQNRDTAIEFINTKNERIQAESGSSHFQLAGNEISDSSEDTGPLFGEEPPRIKAIDKQVWSNVGVVVVGEEGSGRNRWRIQFSPQEGMIEQKMPDELTNRQGGWYFIRIYNNDDYLLESMDFRFSAGLKGIQIINSKCLPNPNGYENVIVQFIHQANYKVEPTDEEMHHALEIRQKNDFTIVTIPPRPDYDETNWVLNNGNPKVKVTVLVERIWWCVGRLGAVPANWTDKSVSLSRKDFTAITDKALWVKFPRKRWISKIEVGFNRTKSRYYNVEVEKKDIAVPLRDFCDAEEIGNKQVEFAMKIWVSSEGTKTYEAIVLNIPTELSLPVEQKPPRVKPPPPLKPEAEVKSPHGERKGKGFSRNEIDNAGLTMEDVKRLHIPYDKRRKSSHSWNIERLKSITER